MDIIYVPISCPHCKRLAAIPFSKLELEHKLDHREAIELQCAYDETIWNATGHERVEIRKLVNESAALKHGMFNHSRIELTRPSVD